MASESPTLHAYLREISTFPALTADDERQLGLQIRQDGNEIALGRLVQANLRLVAAYAKRFRRLGVPLLDLIHEGNLALIEAARRYDPAQAPAFHDWAMWWIRQAMLHLLADSGRATDVSAHGLMAAAVQGPYVEAIRVAIEYAQSAASGRDVREPATSDVEDFAAYVRDEGRRRSRRKRKRRFDLATLEAVRHPNLLQAYLN